MPELGAAEVSPASAADQQPTALLGMSLPGASRIAGWLFWLVFPGLSVAAIVLAIIGLNDHLGQSEGNVPGQFTVTQRGCQNDLCSVTGIFASDSELVIRYDVAGDPRWVEGQSYRAYLDLGSDEARSVAESWNPSTTFFALAGAGTYLAVVAWLALSLRRKHVEPVEDQTVTSAPNRTTASG